MSDDPGRRGSGGGISQIVALSAVLVPYNSGYSSSSTAHIPILRASRKARALARVKTREVRPYPKMHVLRRRVAALDETTPIQEGRRSLRYRQGIGDAHECCLELLQAALMCHGE